MSDFNSFISSVEKIYQDIPGDCSLLQITVKNYDQLCNILTEKELLSLDDYVLNGVKDIISGICKSMVLEFNKFYYCILDTTQCDKIREISSKVHSKFLNDTSTSYLIDARVAGTKIENGVSIAEIIRILSDHIHYSNSNEVFSWIKSPIKAISEIKDDYEHLNELRHSIITNSACFAFQPVVTCRNGLVEYYECLLRLSNEDFKLISAGPYIMLAEKYGYMTSVDKYVFDMAVNELLSSNNIVLSVNISNIGVQDTILTSYIKEKIESAGVGNRLIIEITETAMNHSITDTKDFVISMKELGCKIALDDFGAGYNSFNQVREFPIDIIKIDGSFIRNIESNQKNKILVDTLIKTAEELGCKTVAEFVETGSIAKQLIELNVDYMQGNFFSPAQNYRSWEKK